MSIVGGVRSPCISSEYFARPRDSIAHSDAGWLRPGPEFEIFRPIVVAYAVTVVDGLRRQQVTAQDPFHHDYVFEDVLTFAGPRVSRGPRA